MELLRARKALLAVGVALGALTASVAGPGDGTVVGLTKIWDKGPAASRFNLVLIAEGYTAAQQAQFHADAEDFVDFLFATPPFANHCSAINVWRLDVESDESGADDPLACGGSGSTVDTYFDASFCGDGVIRRLLVSNGATAVAELNTALPEWDQALVIVNSTIYGGSGGGVGTTSVSGTWENIAVHEFGHSAFGLADEYEYWAGCGTDTMNDNHAAVEPVEPNVTIETNPVLIKWASLIDGGTPIPTTVNADCTMCDSQANPYPGSQVVGLYEGAHYYHCDAHRPVFSCMMRNFAPYCPVCTQRILNVLGPYEPANTAPTCDAGGPYVAECAGATTSVQLEGEAEDFDCDLLTFAWTGGFQGGMASGAAPLVTFAGLGAFGVSLQVDDEDDSTTCMTSVTVQDTLDPLITAPADVTVECASPMGNVVDLGLPIVSDVCDADPLVTNDAPAIFPLGTTLVTWTATDDSLHSAMDTQNVTVDDTTPPMLSVSASPANLWPPNHKFVRIDVAVLVNDVCDATPTVRLVSITSNEPENGLGDGNTAPDVSGAAFGTDDRTFFLRSERQGGGSGRIYTITYEAEDGSGNVTVAQTQVLVAHDQGH